jgi:hypothetical protein
MHRNDVNPWKHLFDAALGLVLLMLVPSVLPAADPEWKVGLGQVKITPEKPIFLAGYASRNHPFEKVENDLYAKAMVLEDSAGQRAALVTSDLVGFPAAIAEPICERIREQTGLKRERIMLSVAHVHTGPQLSLKAEPHGGMTAADAERTVEYTRQLQDKVVALVAQAAARLEPARLLWGSGIVHFVMNRREFTPPANPWLSSLALPFITPPSRRITMSSAATTPVLPRPTSRSNFLGRRRCSSSGVPGMPIPTRAAACRWPASMALPWVAKSAGYWGRSFGRFMGRYRLPSTGPYCRSRN